MNNIGQRIKELRRKKDLTQEKLADFLGVTYQSVSKWECGNTMPDLALIVPLARVLGVSADVLLGMKPAEQDERKAYFDAEYHQFWKKDHEADLEIARRAVGEYPGDYRYLYWLASDEWYVGSDDKYSGTENEKTLIESAVRHYEMVLEGSCDASLRDHAAAGLTYAYLALGKKAEAKACAMQYSEDRCTGRDELLLSCTEGEESELIAKRLVTKSLLRLCTALSQLWFCVPSPIREAMDAEEAVIRAVISDGNDQHFHSILALLYKTRAQMAMRDGDADTAVLALSAAMRHAEAFDAMIASGKEQYTCAVLKGYTEDHTADRGEDWCMTESIRASTEDALFAPLRGRADFEAIIT